MKVSTLPEIRLMPDDMKYIIELVAVHDKEIAARLDESYHMARYDVFDNPDRIRFMCSSLSLEEAVQIQHWLHMAELSADTNEAIELYAHLAEEWRAVSVDAG